MYKGLPSVQHMKMFNRHLFANVAEEVEGYNAETGKFYRFLRLRKFLDSNLKFNSLSIFLSYCILSYINVFYIKINSNYGIN